MNGGHQGTAAPLRAASDGDGTVILTAEQRALAPRVAAILDALVATGCLGTCSLTLYDVGIARELRAIGCASERVRGASLEWYVSVALSARGKLLRGDALVAWVRAEELAAEDDPFASIPGSPF